MIAYAPKERLKSLCERNGDGGFEEALCDPEQAYIFDLVEKLHAVSCSAESTIEQKRFLEWKFGVIAYSVEWNKISSSIKRVFILMLYNCKEARRFVGHLIFLKAAWLEDFQTMAREWLNVDLLLTELVIQQVMETAIHCRWAVEGRRLQEVFAHSHGESLLSYAAVRNHGYGVY